jgi:hypothetical protein
MMLHLAGVTSSLMFYQRVYQLVNGKHLGVVEVPRSPKAQSNAARSSGAAVAVNAGHTIDVTERNLNANPIELLAEVETIYCTFVEANSPFEVNIAATQRRLVKDRLRVLRRRCGRYSEHTNHNDHSDLLGHDISSHNVNGSNGTHGPAAGSAGSSPAMGAAVAGRFSNFESPPASPALPPLITGSPVLSGAHGPSSASSSPMAAGSLPSPLLPMGSSHSGNGIIVSANVTLTGPGSPQGAHYHVPRFLPKPRPSATAVAPLTVVTSMLLPAPASSVVADVPPRLTVVTSPLPTHQNDSARGNSRAAWTSHNGNGEAVSTPLSKKESFNQAVPIPPPPPQQRQKTLAKLILQRHSGNGGTREGFGSQSITLPMNFTIDVAPGRSVPASATLTDDELIYALRHVFEDAHQTILKVSLMCYHNVWLSIDIDCVTF